MSIIPIENTGSELQSFLERIERGEEVVVTRSGRVIARILREEAPAREKDSLSTAERFRKLRNGVRLNGLTIREMREEGRR